ncbi:response regulator [Paenibacillus sp. PL91]|uniref:response regulator transcription factor n=1 Tax=Paenibacillus sp. PL91 TaxID=2729538 RepID=UPI00145D795A|nr:response regulator [Paenibacillus sp. PL91]MBC9200690.1 response regulator [Paenibacillus sp. PL91]
MYNVLIVDDEPWVAYGITHVIDWTSLGYNVIGEAHDGLSALQIIKEKKPELIISDIRMPGLDGIELLEQINLLQLETKVILISGYADFEYAQKALRLGAFDYLLKQVDKIKLTESVGRLSELLQQEREAAKGLDLFLDELFEWLEPDNRMTIGAILANKGVETPFPDYRFLNCLYSSQLPAASLAKDGTFELEGVIAIKVRTGLHKQSILLNYDESKYPLHFLNYMTDYLLDAQYIGISSLGQLTTPVARLYQESDIAVCTAALHQGAQMLTYKPFELSPQIRKGMLNLEVSIKEKTLEQIVSLLDRLCGTCKEQNLYIDQIAMIYNQIVSIIYKYHGGSNRIVEIEHLHYEHIARYYSSAESLFDRIKSSFDLLMDEEVHIHNVQVEKILEYIDSRFTEDLLFSDIAKHFKISIGYLSTLIKKETGMTYSDYIMNKRLSMAKELLVDASLSIQDIVQRVGYKDYFHFNKLFKKQFGITPSKYRKL